MFASLYLPPLPGRAADARAQLMAVAREFSPRVERLQDDLVTLDVSGLGRWFENSRALGEALRRTAADRGLAAHVAVAATRTAAVLCTRGRAGLTVVPPGEEAARLASLPLKVLTAWSPTVKRSRWPGSPTRGPNAATALGPPSRQPRWGLRWHNPTDDLEEIFPIATLKRWGLRTLGDLANLPGVELSERLGQAGIVWQKLARGENLQPLVPALPDERYEESLGLEWPIEQLEPLSFVLDRLLEVLCVRLEQADRGVAVLHVRLDLVGRDRFVRALQLPAPMRDARTLRTLALLDLESNPPPAAIDRVTVAADVVEGRVLQFSLLQRALPAERLSTLLARLSALMGSDRVGAPALVDSYRPGACAMAQCEAPAAAAERLARETAAATDHRLLTTAVIRRFRQPIPARVDVHHGRPVRVTSNRRHLRGGYVEVCAGPWRSSGDWWARAPAASARGWGPARAQESKRESWDRDEWEVTLRDGARYVVFQDRQRGCWFIDGILD